MVEKYLCYWCGEVGLEEVKEKTIGRGCQEKMVFRCSNCGETWYFTAEELSQLSRDTKNHLEKRRG